MKKLLAVLVIGGILFLNVSSVFAQLGDPLPPPPEPTPPPVETPPPPPAPDLCPNIDGTQESIPSGMILESGNCVTPIVIPPADTTGPVISGAASLSLATHNATIVWTTDELAVSTFEYGTTGSYGSSATLDATLLLAHTAILTGLTPGTTYHYCIHAHDLANNMTNSCGHTFTTASQPVIVDTTPPDVTLITVAPITSTGATINFTTEEVGNARVEYGTTAGYGDTTTLDTNLALTHTVALSGLTPNTIYHYRIITSDQLGNETITSDENFTTATVGGDAQVSGLTISEIATASVSTSTVTITWQTDLPSDSQIEYGDSENFGSATTLSTNLTTSHSVTITSLTQNTNYIFRVKSKPLGVSVATISTNYEFNTLTHSVPVVSPANIISVSSGSVTSTGATLTWTTDKGATSQVGYGISSGYGVLTAENLTLATSHSVSLTNLEPGTAYHYRVKSVDEVSNITFSEDYTFTTSAASSNNIVNNVGGTSIPVAITTLTIGGYDNASVELEWHVGAADTDVAAQYDVRYGTSPIDASNFAQATAAQIAPIYHGDVSPIGTERAYIIAGLNPNTTYHFALKSKHENSAYSDISNVVSVTTTGGESVNNESNQNGNSILEVSTSLGNVIVSSGYGGGSGGTSAGSFEPTVTKAESADGQIIFEWNNPGEANFVRTVVVRKEGSYPTSPSDGQAIYEGRGDTYSDTNLQNGKTYYYTVYSYNHSKTYSKGVNISLSPNAGNKQVKFNESGTLSSSTPVFHFVNTWQKGTTDIEIEHLQEILHVEGTYPEKYITGYFGDLTFAALKRFQAKHNLPQTGLVDVSTQQKLNTVSHSETKLNIPMDIVVFETDLKRGDQGEAVKDLQQYLIYEGSYIEAIVSGYFGNLTHNAVKTFQAKYGIDPVSGFVGYKTRHKMQQLVGL